MKILVVEDEHHIATSIKKGLEQERYTVDVAFDGVEGYDLAEAEAYDAIILDLMLPGMTGLEICDKLRQNKINTPVLILTARGQLDDKITGLDHGADDYLTKPFAFEELLARLRAITRRPPTLASSEILTLGNLCLNPRTFEVTRAKRSIRLSSREFALLEFFLRHPGQVLSKEQIISHVWSYDSDILPNTVEVYVRNLRRKIDHGFAHPLIHTLRGFGYKLDQYV